MSINISAGWTLLISMCDHVLEVCTQAPLDTVWVTYSSDFLCRYLCISVCWDHGGGGRGLVTGQSPKYTCNCLVLQKQRMKIIHTDLKMSGGFKFWIVASWFPRRLSLQAGQTWFWEITLPCSSQKIWEHFVTHADVNNGFLQPIKLQKKSTSPMLETVRDDKFQ